MKGARRWGKTLLWLHLFVCCVWLYFFRFLFDDPGPIHLPEWVIHTVVLSILGIQFTWGFTVGLLVGPSRKRRNLLWWSLLTSILPLWFFSLIVFFFSFYNLLLALVYLAIFVMMLACETYCGVLLGVQAYSESERED